MGLPSRDILSVSEDTDGVGRIVGEEPKLSDSVSFADGGSGGIFGVEAVLSELLMGYKGSLIDQLVIATIFSVY